MHTKNDAASTARTLIPRHFQTILMRGYTMPKSYAINEYSAGLATYRKLRNRFIAGAIIGMLICLSYNLGGAA